MVHDFTCGFGSAEVCRSRQDHCHYFLVLETDAGTTLLTEKLSDGTVQMLIQPAPWSHKTHWCWDVGFTFFKHYWMDPWLMLHFLLWSTASSEFFRAGRSQSVFQKHFGNHGAILGIYVKFQGCSYLNVISVRLAEENAEERISLARLLYSHQSQDRLVVSNQSQLFSMCGVGEEAKNQPVFLRMFGEMMKHEISILLTNDLEWSNWNSWICGEEKVVTMRDVKLFQGASARCTIGGATASAKKLYATRMPSGWPSLAIVVYGCFGKYWYPKMDGLQWKSLLKWMIWGYHHLRKHPYQIKQCESHVWESNLHVLPLLQLSYFPRNTNMNPPQKNEGLKDKLLL